MTPPSQKTNKRSHDIERWGWINDTLHITCNDSGLTGPVSLSPRVCCVACFCVGGVRLMFASRFEDTNVTRAMFDEDDPGSTSLAIFGFPFVEL